MRYPFLNAAVALALTAGAAAGFDALRPAAEDDLIAGLFDDLGRPPGDFERLRHSHLSMIAQWTGVEPTDKRAARPGETYGWRTTVAAGQWAYGNTALGAEYPARLAATPAKPDPAPARTWLAIPESGAWRVWVSYACLRGSPEPFRLELGGANTGVHEFGGLKLDDARGRELQERFPVRFETDAERELPFTGPAVVWEYTDIELKAGVTEFAVAVEPGRRPVVECLFLTPSRAFAPSRNLQKEANTLTRHYLRYRYSGGAPAVRAVQIKSFIRYQWIHFRPNFAGRLHYGSMGSITNTEGRPAIPTGAWSAWTDVTETMTSAGPYATDSLTVTDAATGRRVAGGEVAVEWAWRPDTNTLLKTLRCPVWGGGTVYSFPTAHETFRAPVATNAGEGVWGMRAETYRQLLRSEPEMLETVYGLIAAADLKDSDALPRRIKFITSCGASPAVWDDLIPHLKRLGFNWLLPVSGEWAERHDLHPGGFLHHQSPGHASGTHDPLDPSFERVVEAGFRESFARREQARLKQAEGGGAAGEDEETMPVPPDRVEYVKMGDEIGPVSSPVFINGLGDCRAAFEAYLREQAAAYGEAGPAFFGVTNWADVDCLAEPPPDAGRGQRRAYYFSRLFNWRLTDRYYATYSRVLQRIYPNAMTWCNYTPGSFMHGGRMYGSDWFALPRGAGVGLAWGEDWLYGEQMAGVQTVGYYGAIVECAARKRGLPKGFYVVGRTGSLDRKVLMLVARGHTLLYIYDWGPEYTRGAVDTWSHVASAYPQVGRVARAVGPADEILADGRREPARVAVLYNQTQEFWRGAWAGAHFDRLLTWLALQHAHLSVDLILEEDLTAAGLAPYRAVYAQGLNMTRSGIAALADWVEQGGVLAAWAGTGLYDEFDEPLEAAAVLFGARQRLAGLSAGALSPATVHEHEPIDTLTLTETPLTPAVALPVVGPKVVLDPLAGGEVAGRYADGTAGAVTRAHGKGRTLLLGVMAGHLYRQNAPAGEDRKPTGYTADRRAVIVKPALAAAGPGRIRYTEPLVECTLVEHPSGLAVTLTDFSERHGQAATLAVETDRPVKTVTSSLRGPLTWKREDGRIVIECPVPDPVDVVTLR